MKRNEGTGSPPGTNNVDTGQTSSSDASGSVSGRTSSEQALTDAPPLKIPLGTLRGSKGVQHPQEQKKRKARSPGFGTVSPSLDTTKLKVPESPPSGSIGASPSADAIDYARKWSGKPMHWHDAEMAEGTSSVTDNATAAMVQIPADSSPSESMSPVVKRSETGDGAVDGSSNNQSSEHNSVDPRRNMVGGNQQNLQQMQYSSTHSACASISMVAGFGSALSHSQQQPCLASTASPESFARQQDLAAQAAGYKHIQPLMADSSALGECGGSAELSRAIGTGPGGLSQAGIPRIPCRGFLEVTDSLGISEPQLSPHVEMHVNESNMQSSFMYEDRRVQEAQQPVLGDNRGFQLGAPSMLGADDTVAFEPTAELTPSIVNKIGTVQNSWFERSDSGERECGATVSARAQPKASSPAAYNLLSPGAAQRHLASLAQQDITPSATPTGSVVNSQVNATQFVTAAMSPSEASPHHDVPPGSSWGHSPPSTSPAGTALSGYSFQSIREPIEPSAGRMGVVESEFSAMYGSASDAEEHTENVPTRNARKISGRLRRRATRQQQNQLIKSGSPAIAPPPPIINEAISEGGLSSPASDGHPAVSGSPLVAEKMTPTRRSGRQQGNHSRRSSTAASPLLKQGSGAMRMNEAVMRMGSFGLDANAATPLTAASSARGRDSTRNRDLVQDADMHLSSPQAEATIEAVIGGPVPLSAGGSLASGAEGLAASPAVLDAAEMDQQLAESLHLRQARRAAASACNRPVCFLPFWLNFAPCGFRMSEYCACQPNSSAAL
jgi:hypothetical protein